MKHVASVAYVSVPSLDFGLSQEIFPRYVHLNCKWMLLAETVSYANLTGKQQLTMTLLLESARSHSTLPYIEVDGRNLYS